MRVPTSITRQACACRYEYKSVVIDPGRQDSEPCWFFFQWSNQGLFFTWDVRWNWGPGERECCCNSMRRRGGRSSVWADVVCVLFPLAADGKSTWQRLSVLKCKPSPSIIAASPFVFIKMSGKAGDSSSWSLQFWCAQLQWSSLKDKERERRKEANLKSIKQNSAFSSVIK